MGNDEPCGFLLPSQTATEKYAVLESLRVTVPLQKCAVTNPTTTAAAVVGVQQMIAQDTWFPRFCLKV